MAKATNEQVQTFSDTHVRQRCEAIMLTLLQMEQDLASITDVYNNLTDNPTWADSRRDVTHQATPTDILAINTVMYHLTRLIRGTAVDASASMAAVAAQLPIVQSLCVRQLSQG